MPFGTWIGCVRHRSAELRLFCAGQGEPGTWGHVAGKDTGQENRVHTQPASLHFVWSSLGLGHWRSGGAPRCGSAAGPPVLAVGSRNPTCHSWVGLEDPCPRCQLQPAPLYTEGWTGKSFLFGPQCGGEGGPEGGQPAWEAGLVAVDLRPALSLAACPGKFMCSTGRCIQKELRCDGWADCTDYSDELNCRESPLPTPCPAPGCRPHPPRPV